MNPEPKMPISGTCPNCQKSIPKDASYCPHCGFGKKKIFFANDPDDAPAIRWIWVLVAMLLVPLAACGGCFVTTMANFDHPSKSEATVSILMWIEGISFVIGLIMVLINSVHAVFNRKK